MKERLFNILLVDDSENNLQILEDMLEMPNRCFFIAESGEKALKIVADNDNIALIILDVQMPGMDGFDVAMQLKSNASTKHIPIIFVSGVSKKYIDIVSGFEQGAVDYLLKPLDVEVTRARVKVFEDMYYFSEYLKQVIKEKSRINEQLNRYVYVVAHDLRAPLAGIISITDILNDHAELRLNSEFREFFPLLRESATTLMEMIHSILVYSKESSEKGDLEEVAVHHLVSIIIRFLFPPKNIRFHVDEKLPTVYTEKVKLMQVFQNLIENAIKYNDKAAGEVTIGYEDAGDYYRFFVTDNGKGLSDKNQAEIFKLFVTANDERSGTGIGLDVVKMIVEQQGGNVSVTSTLGKGSCFYFTWPKGRTKLAL